MQPEEANSDLELTVYGEHCLIRWISIQLPIVLGDVVLIVPHATEEYSWKEAFVVRVGPTYIHLFITSSGIIIRRSRAYLWAITNERDWQLRGLEATEFPQGYEPPDNYLPPPSRAGVPEVYYDRGDEADGDVD